MKMKSTIALLFVAALAPLTPASFGTEGPSTPVAKIGTVTVALTLTSEIGGFSDGEGGFQNASPANVEGVKEVYKTVIKTQRYSTTEMITDLMSRYELGGEASQYSIKFLDTNREIETYYEYEQYDYELDEYFWTSDYAYTDLSGYFLVGPDTVRYIGGYEAYDTRTLAFDTAEYEDKAEDENAGLNFHSETETNTVVTTATSTKRSNKGTYTSTTLARRLFLTPYYDSYEVNAVVKSGGTYDSLRTDYFADVPDTCTSKYTVAATSFTNIVGYNYDMERDCDESGIMMTGSFTITALKDTTIDLQDYVNAMSNWLNDYYNYSY